MINVEFFILLMVKFNYFYKNIKTIKMIIHIKL